MRFSFSRWLVVAFIGVWCSPVVAADLSKIDRTIAKEPTYEHKPKYCLLVFGPNAKTRVWLVLDGDVLYVDCNANGDLTEKNERIAPVGHSYDIPTIQGRFTVDAWVVGLKDGEKVIRQIRFRAENGKGFHPQQTHGFIHLSTTPKDAPILHFGGPLTLTLMGWDGETKRFRELPQGEECLLSILVGTPVFGSRREAFAVVDQDFSELAGAAFPTVDIEFPGTNPTQKAVAVRAKTRY